MEYIKANNTNYECKEVSTGINSISFKMEGQTIAEVHETFKNVTDLMLSSEDGTVYGVYDNLYFTSATVDAENNITVTMSIKSNTEIRLKMLENAFTELLNEE